jgi:Zn-dependent protease with chaperone function
MAAGFRRRLCLSGIALGLALGWPGRGAMALQLTDEPVALSWTPAEVQRAGLTSLDATVARARARGELGCERHCERLARIFDSLLVQAREQTARAHDLPWSLTVVRSPGVDAFALPDGQIVISEALIDERGLSDEALAFVLAHEMAHSILEHERQMLTVTRQLLPSQVERSVNDMYVELAYNFSLLRTLEPVLHQAELEADELGLLLAALCGYAPNRQIEFMQNEVAEDDGSRKLASTHPSALVRLERLQERLPLAWKLHAAALRTTPQDPSPR